jgi:hypothetical protein
MLADGVDLGPDLVDLHLALLLAVMVMPRTRAENRNGRGSAEPYTLATRGRGFLLGAGKSGRWVFGGSQR